MQRRKYSKASLRERVIDLLVAGPNEIVRSDLFKLDTRTTSGIATKLLTDLVAEKVLEVRYERRKGQRGASVPHYRLTPDFYLQSVRGEAKKVIEGASKPFPTLSPPAETVVGMDRPKSETTSVVVDNQQYVCSSDDRTYFSQTQLLVRVGKVGLEVLPVFESADVPQVKWLKQELAAAQRQVAEYKEKLETLSSTLHIARQALGVA